MALKEIHNWQTAANPAEEASSLKTLESAINKILSVPGSDQWVLVSPHGNIYKGSIEDVLKVIIQNHPAIKLDFNEFVEK